MLLFRHIVDLGTSSWDYLHGRIFVWFLVKNNILLPEESIPNLIFSLIQIGFCKGIPSISPGSDHKKSKRGPSWGVSWTLLRVFICSVTSISGDNPLWTQKNYRICKERFNWFGLIYRIFNNCDKRKVVEGVSESLPDVGIPIFSQAFIIKSIHLWDDTAFSDSPE